MCNPAQPAHSLALASESLRNATRVTVARLASMAIFAALGAMFSAFSAPLRAEDKGIPGIGPIEPLKQLHTGFEFVEGPAAVGAELFFTDIPKARVHKLDAKGQLSVWKEHSGHANGLMARGNELLACQMDGRLVAWSLDGKQERVLASEHDSKRFNAPNDLVVDREGGVYFTDPAFRAPMPLPQGKTRVYYLPPQGVVLPLVDDLPNPNGIILSPDEKTLYVIPSGQAEMMVYPVESPGKLGRGQVFCSLRQAPGQKNGGGDGLAIDQQGNLYITSKLGIQVFDSAGKLLGILEVPEQPANVTFGGPDRQTLYVTARKSLYSARMQAVGHSFAAPLPPPDSQ